MKTKLTRLKVKKYKSPLGFLYYLLFFALFLNPQNGFSQNSTITGAVSDQNGSPMLGVSIVVKGTTIGVTTNFDGDYSIVSNAGDVLVFSFLGYKTREIAVSLQTTINVTLEEDLSELDEVVVVGYGTQKKSDLTGSVSVISSKRLTEKPNTNFRQALQGSLPGITVNTNSSNAEGNDISLIIRGRNSISASNSPLVVYDGIPYSGSISDINPNDIKSISVLKDASATAIYGSRGSNGVILIETKKGVDSKPTISYNGYTGINKVTNLPDVYQGQGFATFKEIREPGELTQTEIDNLVAGNSTDWLGLATRTAFKQEHNLSVSGASNNANYYVSLGHQDVEGIAINDKFKRTTLRTNLTLDITDHIKFGTSTQVSYIDRSGLAPSFGSQAAGVYFTNPLTNAYNPDGSLTIFPWPEEEFFTNPLAPTLAVNEDISRKVFSANYLEFKIPFIDGLSYKLNTGVEYTDRDQNTYWGRNTARGLIANGQAIVENSVTQNFTIEHILNYNKTFGKHSLGLTGLYSAQKITFERHRTTGEGFPNDLQTFYQLNSATLPLTSSQVFDQETLASQMGRLNYNFADRYALTLTVRRDGFTGFGENDKYGIFPSGAITWNISNEDFFSQDGIINFLKLRLSHGESGNQGVGSTDNLALLSDVFYLDGDNPSPGFVPSRLANPNLSWETTSTSNIGLDVRFMKSRFQLTLDAYFAKSRDLLFTKRVPALNGSTTFLDNVAETESQGIEAALSGFIVDNKDFKWSFNGNFSYNKNEITKLQSGVTEDVASSLFVGQPVRINYGLQFDGIWQENQDPSGSAQPDAIPGDIRVFDANGDGSISNDDRVIIGQRDPSFQWGFANTFKYKNFSLYVFVHGVQGVTKQNTTKNINVFGGVQRNTFVQNFWTPENPINTFPRNDGIGNPNVFGVRFYEDADFIRVKDVTLSYVFNNDVFKKNNISLKLYATGRNLFTITDWDGLDPELNSQTGAPLQKEFIFGLILKL